MPLIKYYIKGMLSNRNLWFWGVAFMLFWLVLGGFVFSRGIPSTPGALLAYVAVGGDHICHRGATDRRTTAWTPRRPR